MPYVHRHRWEDVGLAFPVEKYRNCRRRVKPTKGTRPAVCQAMYERSEWHREGCCSLLRAFFSICRIRSFVSL